MNILNRLFIALMILCSTANAGEICRIYPNGSGDNIANVSVSRASDVTGISLLGEIQTWGNDTLSFRDGRMQSNPTSGFTNLHEYYYDFTEYTASNISLSANLTGPNNQSNYGYTATATSANGTLTYTLTTTTSQNYDYAVWMKRVSGTGNIDLTLDGGSTWTTKILSTAWQRFDITQSLANPIVGIRIVTDTDSVGLFGSQVTNTVYPLPDTPTNGSTVSVAGESNTVDISTNAALRDAISDSDSYDTDGESIFTMLAVVVPRVDFADYSDFGRFLYGSSGWLYVYYISTDDFVTYDGSTLANAYAGDSDPTANNTYWVMVTADSVAGERQLCDSSDYGDTWNCGTVAAYDGSMSFVDDITIGYNNENPFDIGPIIFYDEVLTTDQATAALSVNQKTAALLH